MITETTQMTLIKSLRNLVLNTVYPSWGTLVFLTLTPNPNP